MYNQKQKQEKIRYMYENSVHTIYCIQFQVMYCTKVELLFLHYTSSTTFFVVRVHGISFESQKYILPFMIYLKKLSYNFCAKILCSPFLVNINVSSYIDYLNDIICHSGFKCLCLLTCSPSRGR